MQTSCPAKPRFPTSHTDCKINPAHIFHHPKLGAYSYGLLYSSVVDYNIFQLLHPLKNYFEECNWLL